MAKMTVLEMTQNILAALEADDINSLADTPEASDVAEIIKEVYYQMLTWAGVPELNTAYFNLEGLGDTTRPNYLKLPDEVDELFWFRYNIEEDGDTQDNWKEVRYCSPEDFFTLLMQRNLSDTDVVEITTDEGTPLYIKNGDGPSFYTISQDRFIITDSYDSAVDATLQGSKSVGGGFRHPIFTISDSFIPDLDTNLFPYLLAESKAVAFANINQTVNSKQERIAREQKIRHQNERHRFELKNDKKQTGPHYGRRR